MDSSWAAGSVGAHLGRLCHSRLLRRQPPPRWVPRPVASRGIASKFAASEIVRRLIVADAPHALGLGAPGLISPDVWKQPLWYLGLAGWAIGFAGNVYHDEILMDIRRPNNNAPKAQDSTSVGKGASARKYSIPRGGLFEYISFPNYLCECECPSRAGRRITKRRSLD